MNYNITIKQGATFQLQLEYQDDSDNPIDLSGMSARLMVRGSYSDIDPIVSISDVSNDQGVIVLNGVDGTIDITLNADFTTTLTPGDGVWDIELVSGSVVTRLVEGEVSITPEVTK